MSFIVWWYVSRLVSGASFGTRYRLLAPSFPLFIDIKVYRVASRFQCPCPYCYFRLFSSVCGCLMGIRRILRGYCVDIGRARCHALPVQSRRCPLTSRATERSDNFPLTSLYLLSNFSLTSFLLSFNFFEKSFPSLFHDFSSIDTHYLISSGVGV